MKKALVISLGSRSTMENYGAVIQIIAFCHIVKNRYSIDTEVLDYIGINCKDYLDPIIIKKIVFGDGIKGKIKSILFGKPIVKRFLRNYEFIKSNVRLTNTYDYNTIKNANFDYDYYVAVSDVIWDPTFRKKGFDNVFFLKTSSFLGNNKYVYSASLGNANYSNLQKREFAENIKGIKKYSVREEYSKKYLETFIQDEIDVTLDPTLLVNSDFYMQFISKSRPIQEKYVLVYTPGFNNQKMIDDAKEYAKIHKYKLLYISRFKTIHNYFHTIVNADVSEFISLLYYCECFFCDSFHGVCLSVMLKKEFYVYEREDGRKILDICRRLELSNRIVHNQIELSNIDFANVYNHLKEEKKNSLNFLDDCFLK